MFFTIKKLFKSKNHNYRFNTDVERYLGESISLIDLETRQRQIDRGEAPFQKYSQMLSRGWIQ